MTIAPFGESYVELHCHSWYSLLDGASSPEALVARAAALGMPALALTDRDNLHGAVAFDAATRAAGIQPIYGADVTLADGARLTLLARDAAGWRSLCTLITRQRHAGLTLDELEGHCAGLTCLSGGRDGLIWRALDGAGDAAALDAARRLCAIFGDAATWIEVQHHLHPGDAGRLHRLAMLARRVGIGIVATNQVAYARRAEHPLHEVVSAIRQHTPLDEGGRWRAGNSEYYLKSGRQLMPLFRAYPEALRAASQIAASCRHTLAYGLQDLPAVPLPAGWHAEAFLRALCEAAITHRVTADPQMLRRQLDHELAIIAAAGLSNYLLIVWDIVREARVRGIRCQGRGSAASSLVAYLLGISPIDPLAHQLVFERFLSHERPDMPDIDLDIAADRRDELIRYVVERYGTAHVALACTFSTFGERSARRDLSRVLATPPAAPGLQSLAEALMERLAGAPRHVGQHSGGIVITALPLAERVPTQPAAMPGRTVIQWDKDALEQVGLVKIDLLGLRMLGALEEAVRWVEQDTGVAIALDQLDHADPSVYDQLCAGDTIGVFQVESRAQAQLLPRLLPRTFADIIVAISLIRPGPLQGQMVQPYLRRRAGLEPVRVAHPRLDAALRETLGVIVFQEQVITVARDLAGFSPGAGERLRRALGSGTAAARAALREQFIAGATALGVAEPIAAEVFRSLESFGGYAFPRSHAAAFAVIVYQSAWLRRHHPAALLTALLNHQPMGFWPPDVLVRDARRRGIAVAPIDIDHSAGRSTLRDGTVRLGLRHVVGLGHDGAERLVAARAARPFTDLADCCRRSRLPRQVIAGLIRAGAFDQREPRRRQLLWHLGTLSYDEDALDLESPTSAPELDEPDAAELYRWQMAASGVSVAAHPLARQRVVLAARGYCSSATLAQHRAGDPVRLVGTLVVHQAPPTARGTQFLTLEDEFGMVNVIVRPTLAQGLRERLAGATTLLVVGTVQRERATVTLLAQYIRRWSAACPGTSPASRV
ncbi:MAG: DNA polymerase III subunit alpha [Chloroflexi bacterium]|nr:DNA polymerase III subunit alpha [Chloroflexota bacterium]